MPVRWTADKDQILLLKIVETTNITLDYKAIAAAWPDDGEKPTPRAVSEHIFKLKGLHKDKTSGNDSPGQSPAKTNTTPISATSTPKKRGRPPKDKAILPTTEEASEVMTSGGNKKKRTRAESIVVKAEPTSDFTYPYSPAGTLSENVTCGEDDFYETPSKKLKRSSTFANSFVSKDEDDETDAGFDMSFLN